MTIIRALFRLMAVSVLSPQQTASSRAEATEARSSQEPAEAGYLGRSQDLALAHSRRA